MQTRKLTRKTMVILLSGLLAISLSVGISFAQTDKLVVEDGAATKVFSVDDTGKVMATKVGVGTATPASTLSVVSEVTTAERGFAVTHYSDNAASPAGQFYKARGTEASPTAVQTGDYTGAFTFRNYDGSQFIGNGFFGAIVSGTPTAGSIPTDLFFCNSDTQITNCFAQNKVNLVIKATGEVNLPQLSTTYTGGSAYVCVNNAGDIYASETACP